MAVGPIELNGAISRIQDYSVLKQNEDNKGMVNQQAFQTQFNKEIVNRHSQVVESDQLRKEERKFDAREKGDNEYQRSGGKRQKKEQKSDGKAVVKGRQSFDVKI